MLKARQGFITEMLPLRYIIIYQLYLVLNMKQIAGFRYIIRLWLYILISIHCLPVISAPVEVETMQQITKSDATIFIKVDCWIEDVYIEGIGVFYLFRQNVYRISIYSYLKCIYWWIKSQWKLHLRKSCIY